MKKTLSFSRTTAATICASLMLSGTCLAAPALAFAAGSGSGPLAAIAGAADSAQEKSDATAEAPAEKAEVISSVDAPSTQNADPTVKDSDAAKATPSAKDQVVTAGGIQITVPSDYTVADLGGALVMAVSPSEDIAVTVMPLGLDASDIAELPTDEAELTALFDELSDQMTASFASSEDGSLSGLSLSDTEVNSLPSGEKVYAYLYKGTVMDEPLTIGQYLIILDDDIVMLQLAASGEITDEAANQLADIEESVTLAATDENGSSVAAMPEPAAIVDGETTTVDGIKITVPSSLVLDASSTPDEPTWYSADDTVMLGVISDLTDGQEVDRATNDALAAEVIEQLGAEPVGTDELVTDGGVEMVLYSFGVTGADGDFVGLLGLVSPEPDRQTAILAIVTIDASEEMIEAVEQAYYSVELA